MDTLLQAFRKIGTTRLAVMGLVLVGLVGFFIYLTTRLATPHLAVLYNELDVKDAARIVQQLEAQNVPFEIKNNGTAILVPGDRVARMRMAMAQQGLPSGGSIGYEIFDKADSLGATNFMQNVNLVRALEGELARTIQSISSVQSARVHLVLPKRELFSREKQEPSASVVLSMAGAKRLDNEQIAAVQHLVAAAVPGLQPNRISIVDNKGALLAAGFEEQGPAAVAAKTDQRRRQFENRMARTVEELLEKTVGFGKVRAEVHADVDYDRIATTEEKYDPDGQVVRSTQTIEQTGSTRDGQGEPPVSVATNLPDPNVSQTAGQSSQSAENRNEETVNFEISKKVINHVREAGVVKRMSVAVLIDGAQAKDADGKTTYKPRTKEEMDLMATLVRGTIGFNAERGDRVEVINMPFVDVTPAEKPLELFFGFTKQDMIRMAEILVLSIVAILVILLVVRPLISRAFEALPSAAEMMADARMLADQTGAAPALTGPGGVPVPIEGDREEEQFEELIDIDRVEGRVKASSVKKVGEIVQKHPEEALSILRSWMYQEV